MNTTTTIRLSRLTALLAAALAGCSPEMPDMSTPPPPVAFMTVAPTDLALSEELSGRVTAVRTAEIRAQVTGIVQRRLFEQGSVVRAGQPLFQINTAPFKADADTAAATLQRAEAVLARAATQAERLEPLAETEAISQQAYDDALSQRDQARADVAQARAELARRRLDVQFATVDAPISGRIDQAQLTEGSLVGPGDTTPLAKIQQIDQVYVDVRQPAASLDAMRSMAAGGAGAKATVAILRGDGEPMGLEGRILFSGISVDEGTGDVLVRVAVDNKGHRLLPGMFVRARVVRARYEDALSVPQQAIARSGGQATVWVLGDANKVHAVPVELGELVGDSYHVRSGLKTQDKVIVEGLDRMAPNAVVTPRPWRTAATAQSNAAGGASVAAAN
ncbi:efflux RND transporter periplasmic adaptor subunit [Massilia sp.]|uniref:efflux RND transporter periplasmic adaptor subunit n=1 Tax=Massilia sp. TaxID=1882437 RepID=UPI0028AD82C5|nr:efflux RND transporter periplasmic adaptor subunit [Massilia sp.]